MRSYIYFAILTILVQFQGLLLLNSFNFRQSSVTLTATIPSIIAAGFILSWTVLFTILVIWRHNMTILQYAEKVAVAILFYFLYVSSYLALFVAFIIMLIHNKHNSVYNYVSTLATCGWYLLLHLCITIKGYITLRYIFNGD